MSTVKREAPVEMRSGLAVTWPLAVKWWYGDCLRDLNAGKHAVGCGCRTHTVAPFDADDYAVVQRPNACTEIAKCALEMRSYEVEE